MKQNAIALGQLLPGPGELPFDLKAFCAPMDGQRLLATATSGAGKTHMLRRILEQTHSLVPQLVIDPEGEFSTLRNKYPDYLVLGGDHGDKPLYVEQAHTLAHMLLDLRASVILDLYDFKPRERRLFVANFVQAILDAPKKLWGDWLILVDEAQLFAPEEGPAESLDAMVALATQGRKRGLAAIFATLRLAMISKNLASMCRHKLVGGFDMELDLKRATAELGLGKEGIEQIRGLDRGEFFAYGRVFGGKGIRKVKIGPVETGKVQGRRAPRPVAPDAKIKAALGKLAALPARAAKEAKDLAEARARIQELEGQIRATRAQKEASKGQNSPSGSKSGPSKQELKALADKARQEAKKAAKAALGQFGAEMADATKQIGAIYSKALISATARMEAAIEKAMPGGLEFVAMPTSTLQRLEKAAATPVTIRVSDHSTGAGGGGGRLSGADGKPLGICEKAILGVLRYQLGRGLTRLQLGVAAGYAHSSGNFGNCIGAVVGAGLAVREGQLIKAVDSDHLAKADLPGPFALASWSSKLGKCERAIFDFFYRDPAARVTREALGPAVGYEAGSGNFGNCIGAVVGLGLVVRHSDKTLQLNPDLLHL